MADIQETPRAVGRPTAALARVGRALGQEPTAIGVLRSTVRGLVDELSAGHATVSFVDDDLRLRPAAAASASDDGVEARFLIAEPFTPGDAVRALLLADAGGEVCLQPRLRQLVPPEWANAFSLQALALVPAVLDGRPVGFLTVD